MQGSLSEFRLSEILQLIAVQQKTGLLRLTRGSTVVAFYFNEGVLVATRDRRGSPQDPLLDYLRRGGWLHPEKAAGLAKRLESSREDLVDILLQEQHLGDDEVRAALEDLAQELVHKTFSWRDGGYHFIAGEEALAGLRHRLQLKVDSLLMEGARRADEWPRLLEKLPGPETVVELESQPSAGLGERVQKVLESIQGPTRMGEILRRSRLSEYETYEIVVHGVELGIVRVLEKPRPAAAEVQPELVPAHAKRAAHHRRLTLRGPLVWLLALFVAGLSYVGSGLIPPLLLSETARRAAADLEMERARTAIRDGIEVYRALHGSYPKSLDALAADDLASPELLRRAGPLRYEVARRGAEFALVPASAGDPAR